MSVGLLEEIEKGLTSEKWLVRAGFAKRKDYTPTAAQIERGLSDKDVSVRLAFAQRLDLVYTEAQFQRGLDDPHEAVRECFAKSLAVSLSACQIEACLSDKRWEVRLACASRPDFLPTSEQMVRGLNDETVDVKDAFKRRVPEWTARKEALALKSRHSQVVEDIRPQGKSHAL